jgi:hypothetical protein
MAFIRISSNLFRARASGSGMYILRVHKSVHRSGGGREGVWGVEETCWYASGIIHTSTHT